MLLWFTNINVLLRWHLFLQIKQIPKWRHWRRSGDFIVEFKHTLPLFLEFLLLILSKQMLAELLPIVSRFDSWTYWISTSNHIFFLEGGGGGIWDHWGEWFFYNFEIARVKRDQFQNFQKAQGWISLKIPEPDLWLLFNHTKPTNTSYCN